MLVRVLTYLLIAVALTACSAPARSGATPGQTVVVGDTEFRVRPDGKIAVTVTRTFQGHAASGTAVLMNMDLEAAKRSVLVRIAGTRAWLAILQAVGNDPSRRVLAAAHAIDELGTEYRKAGPNIIDDTAKHQQIAHVLAERGDQAGAADELVRAVLARLQLYQQYFQDQLAE
jgi:hypothetical protein